MGARRFNFKGIRTMRIAVVTIIAALSATPAMAQGFGKSNRHQNQPSPEDTQKKKAAEAADAAYRKAMSNIPDKKPDNDPWRNAR
ncbi:MAG TPA: hypothetical protein VL402_06410 [Xanthobacteraceae bacterium]|nr:hypothetical protein [Xanthobacteraceae bacterium]